MILQCMYRMSMDHLLLSQQIQVTRYLQYQRRMVFSHKIIFICILHTKKKPHTIQWTISTTCTNESFNRNLPKTYIKTKVTMSNIWSNYPDFGQTRNKVHYIKFMFEIYQIKKKKKLWQKYEKVLMLYMVRCY